MVIEQLQNFFRSNKGWVLADQAVFSGSSFVTTLLLARLLTPAFFGAFAAVVLFVYLAISLLNALVIQPLQVNLARIKDPSSYLAFSFWLQLVLSLLLAAGLWVFTQVFPAVAAEYLQLLPEIMVFGTGFIFQDYFRKLWLAQARVRQTLAIDVLTAFLQLGCLSYLLFKGATSLAAALACLGWAYLPSVAYGLWLIRPKIQKISGSRVYLLTHYQQGKWLLLTALVQWWSGNLFVVASGLFLGMQALGAFRLVQSLFGVLNVLLQTFENYALPQTARLLNHSSLLARNYLRHISIRSALLFGSLLLFIFLLADHIIVLAGGAVYAPYAYVVQGMAILYLFIFFGYPIRLAIRALVLNHYFFLGYLLSLLFSLLSYQYLLEQFQLLGAIGGLLGSQLILLAFWQFVLRKNNFSLWK